MTKTDMQAAREWARVAVESAENAQPVSRGALAAARYVLATAPMPTMADVDWDGEVHAGLCAEHTRHGPVVMFLMDVDGDIHFLYWNGDEFGTDWSTPQTLTPLPGTRIDLTPRREPLAPDHPTTLSSVEDYDDAPVGTVVGYIGNVAVKRDNGRWQWAGCGDTFGSEVLADGYPCTVVRWGR